MYILAAALRAAGAAPQGILTPPHLRGIATALKRRYGTHTTMRIAGIDYGTVRIGVATADTEVGIALLYETYNRRSERLDADYFRRLAGEERIDKFVVGLPVHLSGNESEKSREVRTFGVWLQQTTGVVVEFFDERYTSSEAEELLLSAGLTKKRRKERLDQLAAQIMLTAYLEAGARGQDAPESID